MKNYFFFMVLSVCSLTMQAQIQMPQGSPAATVSTVVGLTEVKVEYSRPKVKGRKIFGTGAEFVVPFGTLWRTAANAGSVVTFADDVKFGGKDVPKGKYLLLTIPGASDWTVILYKEVAMGGDTDAYDQSKDQARVTVKAGKLTEKVETFTVEIADVSEDSKTANLQLMWENTSVKIPIVVDFDAKVMKAIEANTKVNPNNLVVSAVYYLENGKDLKQALSWINTALEGNPDAFWILYQKARIQKAMNDKVGALATSKASWEQAKLANRDDFLRMNEELQKSLK
jgi:hypothetical protein